MILNLLSPRCFTRDHSIKMLPPQNRGAIATQYQKPFEGAKSVRAIPPPDRSNRPRRTASSIWIFLESFSFLGDDVVVLIEDPLCELLDMVFYLPPSFLSYYRLKISAVRCPVSGAGTSIEFGKNCYVQGGRTWLLKFHIYFFNAIPMPPVPSDRSWICLRCFLREQMVYQLE